MAENFLSVGMAQLGSLTWVEGLEFVLLTMSVLGQHFVANRDKRGFYFWFVANLAGLIVMVVLQRWIMLCLYLYFLYSCCIGLIRWSAIEKQERVDPNRTAAGFTLGA